MPGKPLFTHPHGNELWAMVLEKAFAKFMGSYAATEGGYPLFAMRAITGTHTHIHTVLPPTRCIALLCTVCTALQSDTLRDNKTLSSYVHGVC
jgi:hypothetical protein